MSYFRRFRFSVKRCWARGGWKIGGQLLHSGLGDNAVGGIHLSGPWKLGLNTVRLSNSPQLGLGCVHFCYRFVLNALCSFHELIASYESHACTCCAIDVKYYGAICSLNYGDHQFCISFSDKLQLKIAML